MADVQSLMDKIQALPAERRGEVEDFVDFLAAKARRIAALERLLEIAPALDAAGAPAISEAELEAEVDAARAARRGRNADRP